MSQDIVEGGDFATYKSKIGHSWRDDVAVQVKAILFKHQLGLNKGGVEEVVALLETRTVDQHVSLQFCAICQNHALLLDLINSTNFESNLTLFQHVPKFIRQNLPASEKVSLHRGLWSVLLRQLELGLEHGFNDSPPNPLYWSTSGVGPSPAA